MPNTITVNKTLFRILGFPNNNIHTVTKLGLRSACHRPLIIFNTNMFNQDGYAQPIQLVYIYIFKV